MAKYKNFAELKISDFRAIKSADINLNGITVVSGINGCGKTTMSVLVKDIYESIISPNSDHIMDSYLSYYIPKSYKDALKELRYQFEYSVNFVFTEENIIYSLDKANAAVRRTKKDLSKLKRILQETLNSDVDDIKVLVKAFVESMKKMLSSYKSALENRDYSYLLWRMNSIYKEEKVFDKVAYIEYGESIIGKNLKRFPLPYAVENVIYIESPLSIKYDLTLDALVPDSLKRWMYNSADSPLESDAVNILNNFISNNNILAGKTYYDKDTFKFFYETHSKRFELKNCATGIKSFSIIQILLNNGHLNDRTLLIIDEPEAHLHPQWIFEYARLLVMLHKELGVKFFIASHSPQMVSSIKYIAEKEGVVESVNFYLAEKENEDDTQYNFKECEQDIEPIFNSFNKFYNKLDDYVD